MAVMDYDSLTDDFQRVPALKLLKAEHAAFIISFLYQHFKQKQRMNVSLSNIFHEAMRALPLDFTCWV